MKRFLRPSLLVLGGIFFLSAPSVSVNAITIVRPIMDRLDDAEEGLEPAGLGTMDVTSSDIELHSDGPPNDRQWVGLRFVDIGIPQGAIITNATVQFMVDETDTENPTNVTILGELAPNSTQFTTTAFDISSRPMTLSAVQWNNIPLWSNPPGDTGDCDGGCDAGPAQRTPDLTPIVQEIVNQPAWMAGNALSILIRPPVGDGPAVLMERTAVSFNRAADNPTLGLQPPILTIEYIPEPTSLALVAVAGFSLALLRRRRS